MINQGERDESLVKLRLIEMRDNNIPIIINEEAVPVTSVGFNGIEYKSLPAQINLNDIEKQANVGNMDPLKKITAACGINKAGRMDKADVMINGVGYSLKSHQAAPPAIVNHTPRNGWLRIAKEKNLDIRELDNIVASYWRLRKEGSIGEDVCASDANCPFAAKKEYLKPFLQYFLYEGTGSSRSKVPANAMLEFDKPLQETTWKITTDNYLDAVWNRLVFSVRNKGMNPKYPNCANAAEIAVWTEYFQGSYKGSLHVRVK